MRFFPLPLLLLQIAISLLPIVSVHSHANHLTLANFGVNPEFSFAAEQRFLLYDVNPGEGFNLRRDVYMRVANVARQLREQGNDFILVLPPWGDIWHWRKKQNKIRWSELFDLDALSSFVPVMEFEEFMEKQGQSVDLVLYLQNYAEGWNGSEGYTLKFDIRPCLEAEKYYHKDGEDQIWNGRFFGFGNNFHAEHLKCLSIQGQSSTLVDAINKIAPDSRSIMIDRAEVILHDHFSDFYYWQARKSMRYSAHLRFIADQFRLHHFPSSNESDIAGNYLCAHLRRADFVWAHQEHIPSIGGAARQIVDLAKNLKLSKVFLSTDASPEEIDNLSSILAEKGIRMEKFVDEDGNLTDAAVSIIDQWICAHSRYFIGTHLSTFSFRIHEDRQILGFTPESTFNCFCPDKQSKCEQPSKWPIVHHLEQEFIQ